MNQIKKIIVSTIIGIGALMGLYTTANAQYNYDIGAEIPVDASSYEANDDMFCIQHGQHLPHTGSPQNYVVYSKVNIKGDVATSHTGVQIQSWWNAKLAYILSGNNTTYDSNDHKQKKSKGPVQNAIWNNMKTWMENVGQNLNADLFVSEATNSEPGDADIAATLEREAEAYANSISQLTTNKMTDNTNKEKIKVVSYKKDNQDYIRVGPFNWTFPGAMQSVIVQGVTINDKNVKTIDNVLYSSFDGNNEYWYGANEIQSGKDFYISVPANINISKITTVKAHSSMPVKTANIWFLRKPTQDMQTLILRESSEEPLDIQGEFDYNITLKGNLKIIKVNKNNKKIKLGGVGFYIQHKESGKYVKEDEKGKISYVETKKEATEFITERKGAEKGTIKIKDLIVGTYVAYETKNPNYGYEITPKNPEKKLIIKETNDGDYDEWEIINKQIYVRLSGYVWKDIMDGKGSDRNGLYKVKDREMADGKNGLYRHSNDGLPDDKDELLDGITVRLKEIETGEIVKDKNGKPMETKTAALNRYKEEGNNGHGEYLFNDVKIENLADYYIEFEYDGLTYASVTPLIEENRGSKAAEKAKEQKVEDLTEFNTKVLSREEFNRNFNIVEGKTRDTGITREEPNDKEKHSLSYHINGYTAEFINKGQYTITANTNEPKYSIANQFEDGIEEIKYINLGLYERERPDIALDQDINNIRLTVNGYEHTYLYNNRFLNAGEYGDGFNVGVKFGSENRYNTVTYSRPIYKSDYDYEDEEHRENELKVYITYEIKMFNKATDLGAQVNSMVDYFDSNYTIERAGTELNERGIPNGDIECKEVEYTGNGKYKKAIITNHTEVEAEKKESIYVQFALNKEAITNILYHDKENLRNVTEINSYSIYDYDGNNNKRIYAGIDKNSNPGNGVPEDFSTHEDDTCTAPGLKLELTGQRQMTGKVFEDDVIPENGQNVDSTMTGKVRQGNGVYDEKEKGIGEVEVTLTEHKENGEVGEVYTTKTDSNGDFTITDYIPGEYTLTYTWGDTTYTVQDYKATIYDNTRDQNNKNWHKENEDVRKNDAMDNYDKPQDEPKGSRKQIDEEIQQITHQTHTKLQRTKMDSTTPTMGICIEKSDDGNEKYGTTDSLKTITDGDIFVPESYVIKNIDFGIIERAKQELTLNKRVGKLKATLANGNVIVDLEIDEDGNRTGEQNNITYMKPSPNTEPQNGFVKLELDNELIQGTTLEVGYVITATNNSELDYLSDKFYHYGIVDGDLITMTPTSIIDYLDKDWSFKEEKNPEWQIKTQEDLQTEDLVAAEVIGSNIGNKWILYTEALKQHKLKPANKEQSGKIINKGESQATVQLNVSKVLTTTDEISLNNETEIIKIDRPGGRRPKPIPGNYQPGTSIHEVDDSMAETTIVTPATGENQNYIIPIMVGTIALLILGAGVIIIKKKVL